MKRSLLMSALVLALAASMPACGGGGASGDPDKAADGAKKEDEGTGDPMQDLKNITDGLQKEIDGLFDPIRNADAVLDSVASLPKDMKALKSKADPKKVLAELSKLLDGGDPVLDGLKLEDEVKAKVQDRIDKVKALVTSVKTMDEKVKALGDKITDALTKVPALVVKAGGKAKAKAMAPFGVSAEDKAKAQQDLKDLEAIGTGFKTKAEGWKKDLTDIPAKAKDLPAKMAKAFKG